MTPPEASSEPSIEEILDSIRQIIADDDDGGATAAPPPPVKAVEAPPPPPPSPPPAPKPKPVDDVIELTDRAPEEAKKAAPPPPSAPAKPPIEVDMQDTDPEPEPPARATAPEPAMDDLESVITQKAEAAATKAFSELSQRANVEKGGGVTIEDVVRYEVRPLLRAWIDKYLPSIVERLLQKELEKISKRFDD